MLAPEQAERIYDAWDDHEAWVTACLSVKDQNSIVRPMVPGPAQVKFFNLASRLLKENKRPVRIVVLKARQVWISMAVASLFWKLTAFIPGRQAMVAAHTEDNAQKIFRYYRGFHDSYRPLQLRGCAPLLLPPLDRKPTMTKLVYQHQGGVEVITAGSPDAGRGFPAHYWHLSEAGVYDYYEDFLAGVIGTVPKVPGTIIVEESTAQGQGGGFYERCRAAQAGESEWDFLFFPWYEHPSYQMPVDDPAAFQLSLSSFEKDLQQRLSLSLRQLRWRRYVISTELNGNENLFRQEFPATPEEAFLASGRPVFNFEDVIIHQARTPVRGRLQVDPLQKVCRFNQDPSGELRIFDRQHPVKNSRYVIGVDTASGRNKADAETRTDPDWSVAQIFDLRTRQQVAVYRARVPVPEFAEMVTLLGRWYNDAFCCVETTGGWGASVIDWMIQKHGYPISLFYQREREVWDRSNERPDKVGWETNAQTKPTLIMNLYGALRDRSITIFDQLTKNELLSFAYDDQGRMAARSGEHDDLVIGLALAVEGMEQAGLMYAALERQNRKRPVSTSWLR